MAKKHLLIKPNYRQSDYQAVKPEKGGLEYLNFSAMKLKNGEYISGNTNNHEYVFVLLGGTVKVKIEGEVEEIIGDRQNVFKGMPYAVYLSLNTYYTLTSLSDETDIAYGHCEAVNKFPNKIIKPGNIDVEIRGGGNATRQINNIVPPGFQCDRLVVVEVYTPSGNWSSYPPHKHDEHKTDADGNLIEADLEETYFYKIDKPGGYAIQQVYNNDRSLDEVVIAKDGDIVLVPEGYHPVVAAYGYNVYYLNFLAGSAQSLKASFDPKHNWINNNWSEKDTRLPMVK